MQFINQIVTSLVDSEKSITDALLKTKVLANYIDNRELLNWVNGELNGYSHSAKLPNYRKTFASFYGTLMNGYTIYHDQAISVSHFPKEYRKTISTVEIYDSIGALEKLINDSKNKFSISVDADLKNRIENSLINMGNPHLQILSIKRVIPATFTTNIISVVRSKLLDFILKIQKEFGIEPAIEELKTNHGIINNIMNATITNGDGNNIVVGKKNKITSHTNIIKGNKEQLASKLRQHQVSEVEIQELLTIVDTEQPPNSNTFGPTVSAWVNKMFAKALDGSWQIGIGAAGTILAEALQQYYAV